MKRMYTIIICIIGIFTVLTYLQWGREPYVCDTRIECFNSGYFENISIVSNKICFFNKEKFAEQLIQKIGDNTIKNVRFSYDLQGYPNGLYISVYMNSYSYQKGICNFEIIYLQDIRYDFYYNIKDNPEKFILKILK